MAPVARLAASRQSSLGLVLLYVPTPGYLWFQFRIRELDIRPQISPGFSAVDSATRNTHQKALTALFIAAGMCTYTSEFLSWDMEISWRQLLCRRISPLPTRHFLRTKERAGQKIVYIPVRVSIWNCVFFRSERNSGESDQVNCRSGGTFDDSRRRRGTW